MDIAFGQEATQDSSDYNTGLVYGSDHAFFLTAPHGWVLDNSSGVPDGLYAVFYPRGGSWRESEAVMYANTSSKSTEGNETVDKVMAYDMQQFKTEHPGIEITDSETLLTKDGKKAFVRIFDYSQHEAVAYIDEETIVSMIVLSARTEEAFQSAFPAFKELVASYSFVAKEVNIEK